MMTTTIPREVRQLLAELELLSHGSTTAWNPTGGASAADGDGVPHGEPNPPHVRLRARYLEQRDDAGRERVVETMRTTLRGHRGVGAAGHGDVAGETRAEEDARILQSGEGFDVLDVARRFGCTSSRVRRLRLADGRDAERGHRVDQDAGADDAQRARSMKATGMSERQIALALGRHRTTVTRWLKKSEI